MAALKSSPWVRAFEFVLIFTSMRGGAKSSTWKFMDAMGLSSRPGTEITADQSPVSAFAGSFSVKRALPISLSVIVCCSVRRPMGSRTVKRTGNGAGVERSVPRTMALKGTSSPVR